MLNRKLFIASVILSIVLGLSYDMWRLDRNIGLVDAAARGDIAAVSAYLDNGVRPDAIDLNGRTALQCAARNGNDRIVRRLLAGGADPNGGLNQATMYGHSQIVLMLVGAGADVTGSQGAAALCNAAESGDILTATLLLRHGVDVNCQQDWEGDAGMTPLLLAARTGSWRMFTFFINCGADMRIGSADGNTALMCAAESDSPDSLRICRYLINRGAWVNAKNRQGDTALINAVPHESSNTLAVLDLLLHCGADTQARDADGETALSYAQQLGNKAAVARLQKAKQRS